MYVLQSNLTTPAFVVNITKSNELSQFLSLIVLPLIGINKLFRWLTEKGTPKRLQMTFSIPQRYYESYSTIEVQPSSILYYSNPVKPSNSLFHGRRGLFWLVTVHYIRCTLLYIEQNENAKTQKPQSAKSSTVLHRSRSPPHGYQPLDWQNEQDNRSYSSSRRTPR